MTLTDTVDAAYREDWDRWRDRRVRAATEAYGIAAGVGTDWLGPEPRAFAHLPGVWTLEDGAVVARGIPADTEIFAVPDLEAPLDHGGELRLEIGDRVQLGRYRVVAFRRVDDRGIRTYDPGHPGRTSLVEIAAWAPDPRFRVAGRLTRNPAGATIHTDQTDGGRVRRNHIGVIEFELLGATHRLNVTESHQRIPGRGFITFADSTSGIDTFRFRFLDVELPEGDGEAELDFNRAYLPPASFHASYSCPTPLPGDTLAVRVEAGERTQVRVP